MTPEKQRIAIAEACGWRHVCPIGRLDGWAWGFPPGQIGGKSIAIPDYLNDLNAMHEVEKLKVCYSEEIQEEYAENLLKVVYKQFGYSGANQTIHASATQRAEAFLRTIGKWEE